MKDCKGSEYAVLRCNGNYAQIRTIGIAIITHYSFQISKGGRYSFGILCPMLRR